MILKKTFAGISKKFTAVMNECEILEKQTDIELAVLKTRKEEIVRREAHQLAEKANAQRLGSNLKKLLTEEL